MTNNNFNNFVGYFLRSNYIQPNLFANLAVLKYDGTNLSYFGDSAQLYLPQFMRGLNIYGEAQDNSQSTEATGLFLTLGTDDTPPTRSDLKLGNSVEDFVSLNSAVIGGQSNNFLVLNSLVSYKGSSPIIIKEMGLNCFASGRQKFLLARETIEPLVINPDDTYSFSMRIK